MGLSTKVMRFGRTKAVITQEISEHRLFSVTINAGLSLEQPGKYEPVTVSIPSYGRLNAEDTLILAEVLVIVNRTARDMNLENGHVT